MNPAILRDIGAIFHCEAREFEAEVNALAKIRKYDEYTYLHSLNVARLSVGLGKRLGLKESMLVDLGWAALLHDIGKLHVPIQVLNKMNKFSADELSIMQSHPVEALAAFAETHPVTLDRLRRLSAAFEHHQRYDLKGYPIVQKKLTLHPFSRIVAVADTFDAMTTDRIYQRRVLPDVALKVMSQGFGTIFDPMVLQAFITGMGAFPVGSLVRISEQDSVEGLLAVVVEYKASSELNRPEVFALEEKNFIDLMDPSHASKKILRSEFPEDHDIRVVDVFKQVAQLRGSSQ